MIFQPRSRKHRPFPMVVPVTCFFPLRVRLLLVRECHGVADCLRLFSASGSCSRSLPFWKSVILGWFLEFFCQGLPSLLRSSLDFSEYWNYCAFFPHYHTPTRWGSGRISLSCPGLLQTHEALSSDSGAASLSAPECLG